MTPVIVLACAGLIFLLAIWVGLKQAGFFRPRLPIRVERRCGDRDGLGLPVVLWLLFSNTTAQDHAVKLAIEYKSGKDMIEYLVITPGNCEQKIPEPQRVRIIRVDMQGHSGLVIHV